MLDRAPKPPPVTAPATLSARRESSRTPLVEQMLDAALAAQRHGNLGELLRQHPRAARWLMRRFAGLVRGSAGDAFDARPADAAVASVLLSWGVAQLRPDGQTGDTPIAPEAWLQQVAWRPMLAVACQTGFLPVPDFPGRYRRRPGEAPLDNLCGLWDVAPSSVYRYLERARQGLAALAASAPTDVVRILSLRQAAADEAMRLAHVQAPADRPAWHGRQAVRAVERCDPAAALWHAWRAGQAAQVVELLRQHAPALAADPVTDALVERVAAGTLPPRIRFELWLARATLARTRHAAEREQQALERALHLAQSSHDRLLLGMAYSALGKFHEPRDADRAFACYQDSAEFLGAVGVQGDDGLAVEHQLTTLARLAWLYVLRNDPRGKAVLDRAEALRAQLPVPDAVLGMLEQTWGEYWRRAGNARASLEHRQRALNIFERLNDRRALLATHLNLTLAYAELQDFDRAIAHAGVILAAHLASPVEPEVWVSTQLNLGLTHFLQGHLDSALDAYGQALDGALKAGLRLHAFRARYNLAEAYYTRFRDRRDPADERQGDAYRQAALDAPASDSSPAAVEAARSLKEETLGAGGGPETDRLLPEESAVHAEAFAEIRRQRARLNGQGLPLSQLEAQLAIATAYLEVAVREREAARVLARQQGLEAAYAQSFAALQQTFARDPGDEQRLYSRWQHQAGDFLDETRLAAITAHLGSDGVLSKRTYAEVCAVSPATASKHLALLTERGLLLQSGKGPSTRYRLPDTSGSPAA
jgi:tetratricopeptide (TPR) repeat protein